MIIDITDPARPDIVAPCRRIRRPATPTFAGCYGQDGYIHDTQCVIYEGPDAAHRGKEICFNSAAEFVGPFSPAGIINTVTIVDVTDKANPVRLASNESPPTATAIRDG